MRIIDKILEFQNRPNKVDTMAEVSVKIKKGETTGEVNIPCDFDFFAYGVDFNPSLIKKKTKKKIKELPLNEPFMYHPNKEEVILEDNEEMQYEKEVERCPHCGQPVVVAEVCETRYRSDPVFKIRLSNPAPYDLEIPVKFGFKKRDLIISTLHKFGGFALSIFMFIYILKLGAYDTSLKISLGIMPFFAFWFLVKYYGLYKWWKSTKFLKWTLTEERD